MVIDSDEGDGGERSRDYDNPTRVFWIFPRRHTAGRWECSPEIIASARGRIVRADSPNNSESIFSPRESNVAILIIFEALSANGRTDGKIERFYFISDGGFPKGSISGNNFAGPRRSTWSTWRGLTRSVIIIHNTKKRAVVVG